MSCAASAGRTQAPDAAGAGQPLARGAVDDVGAQVGVGVAQRLGGVQDQRHPGLPAERRDLGRRLEQAAVARDVGQVHERTADRAASSRCTASTSARPDAVDRQRFRAQAVGPQLRDVRRVLAGQAGHPGAGRQPPAGQQGDERGLRRLHERDVGGGHAGQPADHRPALLEQVVRRRPRPRSRRAPPRAGRGAPRPRAPGGSAGCRRRCRGAGRPGGDGPCARRRPGRRAEGRSRCTVVAAASALQLPAGDRDAGVRGSPSSGSCETSTSGNSLRSRSAGSSKVCVPDGRCRAAPCR